MHPYVILAVLPVLSALIGWFTNYVAIKMLFHPRKKISFLGIPIQGLLPKRQEEIAVQVSETVEAEFLSIDDIVKGLESLDFEKDIEEFIDKVIDDRFSEIIEGIPLMGSFVSGGIIPKVKKVFQAEMSSYKKEIVGDIAERLSHSVDIKEMIYEKISDYDIERLESIVKRIAKSELRHIEILGGVLGLIIGLIQVGIMVLTGLVGL